VLPSQSALHKRRARLEPQIAWLGGVFATSSPAAHDPVVVIDSTPVECGRSVETTRRSQLAERCGYGYSRSHSRWFWGMRLHLCCSLDGTPRAVMLTGADRKERDVALTQLLPVAAESGATIAVGDKGYAGRDFATAAKDLGITPLRPAAATSPATVPTWRPSASASNPPSRPARTSSPSNATTPAPSTT
jgi:hypothetical protein